MLVAITNKINQKAVLPVLRSNKILSVFDQGIVSGSTFVVSYLAALKLGKYEFGLFAFLISISNYIYTFHTALVGQPYQVSMKDEVKHSLIKTGNVLTMYSMLFFAVIFIAYIVFFTDSLNRVLAINFIFFCTLYAFHEFFRRISQSEFNFKFLILLDVLAYLSKALLLGALFFSDSLITIENIFLISNIFFGIALSAAAFKIKEWKQIKKAPINLKGLTAEGKWLLGNAVIFFLSSQVYTFLLAGFWGMESVGILAAVMMPLGLLRPLFMSAEAYLVSNTKKIPYSKQKTAFIREARVFFVPLLLLLLTMIASPKFYLSLFFGDKYSENVLAFRLASVYSIFNMALSFICFYLRIQLKSRLIFNANLFSLLLVLPWGWWVTKHYGEIGMLTLISINVLIVILVILYLIKRVL